MSRAEGVASTIETEEVIAALYVALLDRVARADEIKSRVDALATGITLAEMAIEIECSEEARRLKCRRFAETFIASEQRDEILACAVPLRAEDVFTAIGETYKVSIGRIPGFDEVTEHFAAVVGGAHLSERLRFIAHSHEADAHNAGGKQTRDSRDVFAEFISVVYARCLKRPISEGEIDIWYNAHLTGTSYRDILINIDNSGEALSVRTSSSWEEWDDGTFIQLLYEMIVGRGVAPAELEDYQRALASGTTRKDILHSFFSQFGRETMKTTEGMSSNDPTLAYLFGKSRTISIRDWRKREGEAIAPNIDKRDPGPRFELISTKSPLVSVITSLFKGGRYIEAFLENISSQSIFRQHCELLIIDANSPEGEFDKAKPFLERFDNIRYMKFGTQLGIYEAWNIGIREARGAYITNANLDDCRRRDSLETQAATLDNLPFVDIVYQDVLYSFVENLDFETIARFGFSTELPIISRYNLLEFNSPHNGPMWRRSLHDEVGFFDPSFRSAGDFDFWMRCVLAGKTFYKSNDAHVAYYVNPRGLSTRADTPGAAEANRITKTFNRRLISPYVTMDDDRYAEKLGDLYAGPHEGKNRYAMAQSALRKMSARSRTFSEVID